MRHYPSIQGASDLSVLHATFLRWLIELSVSCRFYGDSYWMNLGQLVVIYGSKAGFQREIVKIHQLDNSYRDIQIYSET